MGCIQAQLIRSPPALLPLFCLTSLFDLHLPDIRKLTETLNSVCRSDLRSGEDSDRGLNVRKPVVPPCGGLRHCFSSLLSAGKAVCFISNSSSLCR